MHYLFYKVNKSDIALLKALLEGYDNMVLFSTIDETIPKIQISVTKYFLEDASKIIADLKNRFYMQQLFEDPTKSQGKY